MKFLKGNQVIIYVIALMLITAGYMNYTTKNEEVQQTSTAEETMQLGDIGDAALVNSNDVVTTESANTNVEETVAEEQPDSNDYFASSKLEREKMYSQMIEIYQNVLNNNNSQEAQKKSATEEIQKINNTKNSIMICENLIKTKGFENSVIFVNGDSINVIIGTMTLEKEQVSQIQNIIQREMKASSENIHIATK